MSDERSRPADAPESPSRRRLFLAALAGAGAAAAGAVAGPTARVLLAPLANGAAADAWTDVGALERFEATRTGAGGPADVVAERTVTDGYLVRKEKTRLAIVADAAAGSGLAALSTTCSHLGCGVAWSEAKRLFLCPCHGGVYGPDGRVVSGPPPKPLTRLPLVIEGGRVRVNLEGAA